MFDLARRPDVAVEKMPRQAEGSADVVGRGIAARSEEAGERQQAVDIGRGGGAGDGTTGFGGDVG